jgi:hypothetical protein
MIAWIKSLFEKEKPLPVPDVHDEPGQIKYKNDRVYCILKDKTVVITVSSKEMKKAYFGGIGNCTVRIIPK